MADFRPAVRRDGFRTESLLDELLVYDLERKKAHCLNGTAAVVYELGDGSRSVAEIARTLAERTGVPADEGLVWFGLDQLRQQGLLDTGAAPPAAPAPGSTRRELMTRLGLAAAVLPAVLSISLPRPASAQLVSPGPTGPTGPGPTPGPTPTT